MSVVSSSTSAQRRYKVLSKVGEGSFGLVFRALDRQEGTVVAVKKVRLKDTHALPAGAMREVMALQRLDHPNVLPLLDLYTHGANLMLVLPFVPHNLASLLAARDAPLPEAQARTLARMMLQGLAACHADRLLHRDLKPSNLLLDARGVLLLADFGQARLLPAPGEAGSLSHDVATRWYRAPELLLGARRYGPGVDLWAAGCTIAQLLSLEPLLPGESDMDQLYLVLQLLGTPTEAAWPGLVELPDYHKVELPQCAPTPLRARLPHASAGALHLLAALLRYEPSSRAAADAALRDAWILHHDAAPTAELVPPPPAPPPPRPAASAHALPPLPPPLPAALGPPPPDPSAPPPAPESDEEFPAAHCRDVGGAAPGVEGHARRAHALLEHLRRERSGHGSAAAG